ncbi:MAG: hypothetical protein GWN07_29620 [Actinobacteria bacterium]|nr:hypothetical protein [Actinomycetota bacterium]NIU69542.1 hypothetical protein [Actinomycetota bacterium]NIV89460.1 hypothetical protein [Actinomycetota bacterium]NIW31412.1 hypothetical protein [Actinomycetota bacterium]NIX23758.1 hypothetical protein [Actinomycetota bacterium]
MSEPDALIGEVEEARARGGVQLVVVRTDRRSNPDRHRDVTAAVHRAIDAHLGD